MTPLALTTINNFQEKQNLINQKLAGLTEIDFTKEKKNLAQFLKEKGLSLSEAEVRQVLEETIRLQIIEFAKKQYLHMEKTDDFTEAGEQRVAISFCRNLLNIPSSREVTQMDANLFREMMSTYDENLGKPSAEKLKSLMKSTKIKFLEKEYEVYAVDSINKVFEFVGSRLRLNYAGRGALPSFIYGEQTEIKNYHKKFKDKGVLLLHQEVARTPNYILSIAATSFSWGTLIRRESCETIFYNKWHSYYETSDFERDLLLSHDYSNIREAIKKKAFESYQVKNIEDLNQKKELFIDEMVEGIVWHELGHEISLEHNPLIDPVTTNLGAALGSFGSNAIIVLKEALADWAPEEDGISGPILEFAQIAKTDYLKAKRMLYVYLSDYWFLDFGEEFMGETTDIIVPLITQFVDANGDFKFEGVLKNHKEIFQFLSKKYKQGIEGVKEIIQNAKYEVNQQLVSTYSTIESELIKIFRKDATYKTVADEEITRLTAFWVNMLGYLKKFAPQDQKKLNQYLIDFTKKFNLELLNKLSGGKPDTFNNSLRDYVIKRMKLIGCFEVEATMTEDELFESIFDELKIPETAQGNIKNKISLVKANKEKVDVAINYEMKPNAFVAVIQKLMLMSDYGDIKSGMSLGENLSEDLADAQKIAEFHKLIAGVKKQISEKMYEKIALIKFNTDYISEELFKKEFLAVASKGSFDLTPLVKEMKFVPFFEEHMLEVYIPLKKGIWDWNTVQAVWRINQDLRPGAEDKQWVVDGMFLENLIQKALTN